jgi:ATP-dependent helicase HrpB
VERVAGELRRRFRLGAEAFLPSLEDIGALCAVAWPDRIAVRRADGDTYLLPNGLGARLGRRTALGDEPALVAIELETGKGPEALINLATSMSLAQVRSAFADSLARVRLVYWDREGGRVSARLEERLGAIVLSSTPLRPEPAEVRDALLAAIRAGEAGDDLPWSPAARQLLSRLRFLQRADTEGHWPDFSPAGLLESLHVWLAPRLTGVSSLADLRRLDLGEALRTLLGRDHHRRLQQGAPEAIQVPSGHRVALDYPEEGPPVLAVKLQEMFGCAETPRVAFGRVPVLLQLLSPARRPLQVTQDLRSFWDQIYPEVKKEMRGRYPRHPWPDDPWSAPATRSTTKRLKG